MYRIFAIVALSMFAASLAVAQTVTSASVRTDGKVAVLYSKHALKKIPAEKGQVGCENVRIADTHSIFGQIIRAHRSEPQERIAAIEKRIKLRTFDLNEMTCPAMKEQVERLEKVQLDVPKFHDPGVFVFGHPLKSEFHIQQGLQQMSVVLLDDDKLPHENALLNWAFWTRRVLDGCAPGR